MAKELACHNCGMCSISHLGGDIYCGPECRQGAAERRKSAEESLTHLGFIQHLEVLNLWEKEGVHISIDQIIREGFNETLAAHASH